MAFISERVCLLLPRMWRAVPGSPGQIFRSGFDDSRVRSPWNNFLASVITVVGVSYFRDAVDHNPNHWCRLEMFVAFLDVRNGGVSHTCDKQDGLHLRQDRNNVVTQQHGGHIK